MFWKTHVFGSVFLGSVFAKVSQIPCFCCFFKWKLRGDFQVVVLKAAKTRGFCMVDLCKVKQQASGNDHPNDCDSSNISHRPPPPPPPPRPHRTTKQHKKMKKTKTKRKNKSHSHGRHQPPPHPPPTTAPHHTTKQHKKMKKTKRKNTSHTSHDRTAPPNSTRRFRKITAHRKERELQVEAGMCRKSRDGPNTAKNDGNATDTENTEKHDAKG